MRGPQIERAIDGLHRAQVIVLIFERSSKLEREVRIWADRVGFLGRDERRFAVTRGALGQGLVIEDIAWE